jgi:hypothetical protein
VQGGAIARSLSRARRERLEVVRHRLLESRSAVVV